MEPLIKHFTDETFPLYYMGFFLEFPYFCEGSEYYNNIQMFIQETSYSQWEVLLSLLLLKTVSKIKS